jgi:hypothetical protein
MEKFTIFCGASLNNFVENNELDDATKRNVDTINSFDPNLLKEANLVIYTHLNDPKEIPKVVEDLKQIRPEILVVTDNFCDILYIYDAVGDLAFIKKNIIPLIDAVYQKVHGYPLFVSKFEDLRVLKEINCSDSGLC